MFAAYCITAKIICQINSMTKDQIKGITLKAEILILDNSTVISLTRLMKCI